MSHRRQNRISSQSRQPTKPTTSFDLASMAVVFEECSSVPRGRSQLLFLGNGYSSYIHFPSMFQTNVEHDTTAGTAGGSTSQYYDAACWMEVSRQRGRT